MRTVYCFLAGRGFLHAKLIVSVNVIASWMFSDVRYVKINNKFTIGTWLYSVWHHSRLSSTPIPTLLKYRKTIELKSPILSNIFTSLMVRFLFDFVVFQVISNIFKLNISLRSFSFLSSDFVTLPNGFYWFAHFIEYYNI